jgi:hypothetical protein
MPFPAVEDALDVHVEQERLLDVLLVQRNLLTIHSGVAKRMALEVGRHRGRTGRGKKTVQT